MYTFSFTSSTTRCPQIEDHYDARRCMCSFWQVRGRTVGEESLTGLLLTLSPFHLVLLGAQSMDGAESRLEQSPGLFRISRPRTTDSTGQPDGTDSLSFTMFFGQFLSPGVGHPENARRRGLQVRYWTRWGLFLLLLGWIDVLMAEIWALGDTFIVLLEAVMFSDVWTNYTFSSLLSRDYFWTGSNPHKF